MNQPRQCDQGQSPKVKMNRTYSVAVVATMSAGKSTLLNAMIGQQLLPSQNEACTASVCRIEDRDDIPVFRGRTKDAGKCGEWMSSVTLETLQKWNAESHDEIILEGNIKMISNTSKGCRVSFIDTPGPNNASCEEHARITERIIDDADFSSIVFVINASVAGVEDEWRLLSRLQQVLPVANKKARIIFVVNKIDLLDAGHGESVVDVLRGCAKHLTEIGFEDPTIVPVCSELALRLRQTRMRQVPYRKSEGRPIPPNLQRRHVFESEDAPRIQARLRRQIETFLSLRKFYRSGLKFSEEGAKALSKIDHRRGKNSERLFLGGKFFTDTDLRCAEKLSGVPILELLLQHDLNSFSTTIKE